jgi:proteasome lid subunit RPN8/RPN11
MKITEVIPIRHGDEVELGLGPGVEDIISRIRDQYLEKELYLIGWYHSHLGYGIYLSNSDRFNHLFFQNAENPNSFAIVFDYKLVEDDKSYGFDIFRFKDPSKGPESEYARVKYEIEKPNTLDFYKWVKNLVEDSQKKVPVIIKEYEELNKVKPEELQEIPKPEDQVIEEQSDNISSQFDNVLTSSREGVLKFNEILGEKVLNEFNNWTKDFYQGSLKGIEHIRSSISQMRKSVVEGFEDVETYFNRTFKEISEIFIKDVSGYLDNAIDTQAVLKDNISKQLQDLDSQSVDMIRDNLETIKSKISEKISHTEVKIHNIIQANSQIKPILEKVKNDIKNLHQNMDSITDSLNTDIGKACSNFESNLKTELEGININSDSIIEKDKEIQTLIERLQKVISDFRTLK